MKIYHGFYKIVSNSLFNIDNNIFFEHQIILEWFLKDMKSGHSSLPSQEYILKYIKIKK